jgi:hypothetical protein
MQFRVYSAIYSHEGETISEELIGEFGLRYAVRLAHTTHSNAHDGCTVTLSAWPVRFSRWITFNHGPNFLTGQTEERTIHPVSELTGSTWGRLARLLHAS